MGSLRVLVVDDERLARVGIRRELEAMDRVQVAGECEGGEEAVRAIRRLQPDLVLLDIQMPGMDGLEVVREVGVAAMPPVVFVTAHDEHALRAFELDAVDYVLKPIEPKRLRKAIRRVENRRVERDASRLRERLQRLLERLETLDDDSDVGPDDDSDDDAPPGHHTAAGAPDRLAVEKAGRISFVDVSDVVWIESAGNYARIHAVHGSYLTRRTMKSLEEDLRAHDFLRVRRSAIVNMKRVESLELGDDRRYRIELGDETVLHSSRRHRAVLSAYVRDHE